MYVCILPISFEFLFLICGGVIKWNKIFNPIQLYIGSPMYFSVFLLTFTFNASDAGARNFRFMIQVFRPKLEISMCETQFEFTLWLQP